MDGELLPVVRVELVGRILEAEFCDLESQIKPESHRIRELKIQIRDSYIVEMFAYILTRNGDHLSFGCCFPVGWDSFEKI
jgi:hypothetical protein